MAFANPFRFSTKLQDDETPFLYYGFRYYAPARGRWLSRDPMQEFASRNCYGFLFNNPGNLFDYLGLADGLLAPRIRSSYQSCIICHNPAVMVHGVEPDVGNLIGPTSYAPVWQGVGEIAVDLVPGDSILMKIAEDDESGAGREALSEASGYFLGIRIAKTCGKVICRTKNRLQIFFRKSKKTPEIFERFGSKVEAEGLTEGFQPKPGQGGNPKWIAERGKVKPRSLGDPENYTHKMTIEAEPGTRDWLKQFELKPSNEPGRYAIPAERLEEFNKRLHCVTVEPIHPK
jgi:RHS repeat-associated protein